MTTVAAPDVYYHCRALLQRRVELASVSGPCAPQCRALVVYPSCASGYHRRAPSPLSQHLQPRSGPALRCGRTLRSLVCSAAATESEGLETAENVDTGYQLTSTIRSFTQVLHLQESHPCPKTLMQLVLNHACMTGTTWPISAMTVAWMLLHLDHTQRCSL